MTRQIPDADPPVLTGVGACANRPGAGPATTVEMMRRAVAEAIADVVGIGTVSSAEVIDAIDLIVTPRGTWTDTDPGRAALRLVAGREISARSVVTEIGVLQQSAIHRAVAALTDGSATAVLVIGGEAKHSADREGVEPDPLGSVTEPDEIVRPHGDIVHRVEIAHGVVVPVQQYALIESALARAAGRDIDEQAVVVAELWSSGSEAVSDRPDAWRTQPLTTDDVLSPDGGNRTLAEPYRRAVVSSWAVDQSVALLFTRADTAAAWGIADTDMVGLVGSATSDHMVPLVARHDLTACPAFDAGVAALAEATGVHTRDVDVADLYSCFPSAVQVAATALGREGKPWTLTGGMATFGGPFNSYALHGIAAMAQELRGHPGRRGVTTCVSGLLTKAGVAIWANGPADALLCDVTDADRGLRHTAEVVDEIDGDATVVASTLVPGRDGDVLRIEIVEDGRGRRALRTHR